MMTIAEIAVHMRQVRRDEIRRRVYEDTFTRPASFWVEPPARRNARLELRYAELLEQPIHERSQHDWCELDEIEDSIMRLGLEPRRFWYKS